MHRLVLLAVVVLPLTALAGPENPQFSGVLGDNDTATFFVRPAADVESWWFEIPEGEYFWLKTEDSTGRELEDTDLSSKQSVTLVGAKGRKVIFRIYEIAGEGRWAAWKGDGPSANDERVVFPTAAAVAPVSKPQFSGYLGEDDTFEFFVRPESDRESWWFEIPSQAFFWVKTQDSTGRELQDTDLSSNKSVTLVGARGRKAVFRIYQIAGSGNWSAWKGTGPAAGNEDAVFPAFNPARDWSAPGKLIQPGSDGRFSGYLGEDESTSFVVRPQSDLEHWRFEIPDGKFFWLKVFTDGEERDDIDLSDYRSVTLKNAKDKKVTLTIYQIGGVGNWSAWKASQPAEADRVVNLGTAAGDDADLTEYFQRNQALLEALSELANLLGPSGTLEQGESDTVEVTAQKANETWVFSVPADAKFKVKVLDSSGKVLRDVDLTQTDRVTLPAAGKYRFVVKAHSGQGSWTASRKD